MTLLLSGYTALLSGYRALLSGCRALLNDYMALLRVYRTLYDALTVTLVIATVEKEERVESCVCAGSVARVVAYLHPQCKVFLCMHMNVYACVFVCVRVRER